MCFPPFSAIFLSVLLVLTASASETIQVDLQPLLDARSVTTLTHDRLVPWRMGIDGDGKADGYMTLKAALANGDKAPHALPDDGWFPANAVHPEIRLHFSNTDGEGPQTHAVIGQGRFSFLVPARRYTRMMLFLTSAQGPSHLTLTLVYKDGSREVRSVILPDYYNDIPPGNSELFSLATDLAKWNATGRMAEANHHFIHGVDLRPGKEKILREVEVEKTALAYLVFWGATGVTND